MMARPNYMTARPARAAREKPPVQSPTEVKWPLIRYPMC
jgi:hypothetical protein